MLLIAEIILTITAWRKGWKGWALLPVGICLAIGFMIGMVAGQNGTDIPAAALIFDLMAVIALIIMTAKGPDKIEIKPEEGVNKEVLKIEG